MPTENDNQSAQVSGVPPPTACSAWKFSEHYVWGCGAIWKDAVYLGNVKYPIRMEEGEFFAYGKRVGHKDIWDAVRESVIAEVARRQNELQYAKNALDSLPNQRGRVQS